MQESLTKRLATSEKNQLPCFRWVRRKPGKPPASTLKVSLGHIDIAVGTCSTQTRWFEGPTRYKEQQEVVGRERPPTECLLAGGWRQEAQPVSPSTRLSDRRRLSHNPPFTGRHTNKYTRTHTLQFSFCVTAKLWTTSSSTSSSWHWDVSYVV